MVSLIASLKMEGIVKWMGSFIAEATVQLVTNVIYLLAHISI